MNTVSKKDFILHFFSSFIY